MTHRDARLDVTAAEAANAEDGDPDPYPDPERETFVIALVDGQIYAIPVRSVRRVLPFPPTTRVPTDAPHVLGVFHHMGQIVPLWDLHVLFAADAPPPEHPRVLVIETETHVFGILVEDVDEVVTLGATRIEPAHGLPLTIEQVVAGTLVVEDTEDDDQGDEADDGVPFSAGYAPDHVARSGLPRTLTHTIPTIGPGWEAALLDPERLYALGTGRPLSARQEVAPDGGC